MTAAQGAEAVRARVKAAAGRLAGETGELLEILRQESVADDGRLVEGVARALGAVITARRALDAYVRWRDTMDDLGKPDPDHEGKDVDLEPIDVPEPHDGGGSGGG